MLAVAHLSSGGLGLPSGFHSAGSLASGRDTGATEAGSAQQSMSIDPAMAAQNAAAAAAAAAVVMQVNNTTEYRRPIVAFWVEAKQ